MRKKKNIIGTCALCNTQNVKLTAEHIFPGTKRNHPKPVQVKIEDTISIPITETQQSRNFQELSREGLVTHEQGGRKEYSLCEKCNNITGSWYGNAYIKWKNQWDQIANSNLTDNVQSIEGKITFNSLMLLKQIVSCFISIDYPNHKGDLSKEDNLRNLQPKLFDFVLDRDMRCSFNDLRIFVHLLRKNTGQGSYTGHIDAYDRIRNKEIYPYTLNLIDNHLQYSLIFDTNSPFEPKYNPMQILNISKYSVYTDRETTKKLRIQEIDGLLKIEAVPQATQT